MPISLLRSRALAWERVFRDRANAFDMEDEEFRRRFRLNKAIFKWLCDELRADLHRRCARTVVPPEMQLLIALNFFASGGFQRNVGDHFQLQYPQSTVSRILHAVVNSIIARLSHIISFPRREELINVMTGFFTIGSFPGVIGAIDCTHIAIKAPPANIYKEESFINRKGYHSINVQIVSDSHLRILNINSLFPGRTHDSFIWRNSILHQNFEDGFLGRGIWLIGDSGYPLEPWLLTPISNAISISDARYNEAHRKTRNPIERCFGVLKQRFRCLDLQSAGGLQYYPEKAGKIIMACALLHNICIANNINIAVDTNIENEISSDETYEGPTDENAYRLRQELILQRF